MQQISPAQLKQLQSVLPTLPQEQQLEFAKLLEEIAEDEHMDRCRNDFLCFVREFWPTFIEGPHLRRMAEEFESLAAGKQKRAAISMAPRSGKSMLTAVYLPAWYLGKFPNKKIMQVSHKSELAVGFGRQVRDLIKDPRYQKIFPGTELKADSTAAGRWHTTQGGSYYATGVGAGLAGFGADLCVSADTIVITENGPKRMEDVVYGPDQYILSYNDKTMQPEMKPIIARGSRPAQRMIEIKANGKTLRCTHDHPVWVEGKGYIQACEVKSGDRVQVLD